jgi:cobalt/nickel transport protein
MRKLDVLLVVAFVALVVAPLVFVGKVGDDGTEVFSGIDSRAEVVVAQIQPSYKPWAKAIWVPPSKEIESLLFSLQAALGGGFLGFFLGRKSVVRKKGESL